MEIFNIQNAFTNLSFDDKSILTGWVVLLVQRREHYDSERKMSVLSRQTWLVHLEPPNFSHFKFRSRETQAL